MSSLRHARLLLVIAGSTPRHGRPDRPSLSSIPLIISTLNDRRFPRGGETPIAYLAGTQEVTRQGFVPSFFRMRLEQHRRLLSAIRHSER